MSTYFSPSGQCLGYGDAVSVFEITADRHASGESRDSHAKWPDQPLKV
jgi:hypothetical protein